MNQEMNPTYVRIGDAIVDYTRTHGIFFMEELRKHVARKVGKVAPGSPDRILRQLRSEGTLDYKVLSRRASLYQMVQTA